MRREARVRKLSTNQIALSLRFRLKASSIKTRQASSTNWTMFGLEHLLYIGIIIHFCRFARLKRKWCFRIRSMMLPLPLPLLPMLRHVDMLLLIGFSVTHSALFQLDGKLVSVSVCMRIRKGVTSQMNVWLAWYIRYIFIICVRFSSGNRCSMRRILLASHLIVNGAFILCWMLSARCAHFPLNSTNLLFGIRKKRNSSERRLNEIP